MSQLKAVKEASYHLTLLDKKKRADVLLNLANRLRKACAQIIEENKKDLALMDKDDPMYDRLLLSEERIHSIAKDLERVSSLPDPLGKCLDERIRPNGLKIQKISVPLGVVAVIYESRPNVTIDVFALCFKSGNACV